MSIRLPHFPSRRLAWGSVGLALAALGCTTGQTGGEIDVAGGTTDEGDAFGAGCEVVETTALELDQETALGIAPKRLVDAISGSHETTLSWGDRVPESVVLTPEAQETTLSIQISPRSESAVLADLQLEESGSGAATLEDDSGTSCQDEIRIVADVTLVAENGALDDTFEMTFRASDANVVRGFTELVVGDTNGSFSVEVDADAEAVQTGLSLAFALGTVSGDISGILQEETGDAVSASPVVYARFPVEGCESGSLVAADSAWGTAIGSALSQQSDFVLTWSDGQETNMAIEPDLGKLCFEQVPGQPGGTIWGDLSAHVVTEDGRVDGQWELTVSSNVDGDEMQRVQVTRPEAYGERYSASDFEAQTGISGVETDATDLGWSFDYSIESGDPQVGAGSLAVLELIVPECADPDYEPPVEEGPDGSQGSPGCPGVDLIEVETASFVAAAPAP